MKNQGFTLVEIIVVVAILSVLMAITVPGVMNYFDDVDEKRILNEAQAVKAIAGVYDKTNVTSLAGEFKETDNEYYYSSSEVNEKILKRANANGKIVNLFYSDGKIQKMIYSLDGIYAVYNIENDKFVIQKNVPLEVISDVLIHNQTTKNILFDCFLNKGYDKIDSEAFKLNDGIKVDGTAKEINDILLSLGVSVENNSYQIAKLSKKDGKMRYQFIITEKKITLDMAENNEQVKAKKYIYYEEGTPDTGTFQGQSNFDLDIYVSISTIGSGENIYPVIKY